MSEDEYLSQGLLDEGSDFELLAYPPSPEPLCVW